MSLERKRKYTINSNLTSRNLALRSAKKNLLEVFGQTKFNRLSGLFLIFMSQVPLIANSLFRFAPLTQGWFVIWAQKLLSGELYSYVYCPLPPLGIIVNGLIPAISNKPLQIDFILNAIIWLAFVSSLYFVALNWLSVKSSVYLTILISFLYFSEPHDFISSYFETAQIFLALTILELFKANKNLTNVRVNSILALLIALPLIKQSFALCSVFALAFLLVIARNRSYSIKKIIIKLTVLLLIVFITLQMTFGARLFSDLSGSAKKPTYFAIINGLIIDPVHFLGLMPSILLLISFIQFESILLERLISKRTNAKTSSPIFLNLLLNRKIAINIFLFAISFSIFHGQKYRITSLDIPILTNSYVFGIFILVAAFYANYSIPKITKRASEYLTLATVTLFFAILFVAKEELNMDLIELFKYFKVWIWPILWFLVLVSSALGAVTKCFTPDRFKITDLEILKWITLSLFVVNSLSGGITIQTTSFAFILFTIKANILFDIQRSSSKSHWTKVLAINSIFLTLIFASQVQVIKNPYTWWALNVPPLTNHDVSANLNSLSGFRINAKDAKVYEKIQQILKENSSNSPNNSILYGPNIAGAKLVFGNFPSYKLHCVIQWWDVCPDSVLHMDFINLKKNPPRFILWAHFPEFVVEGHEKAFRKVTGQSELRKLDIWIEEQKIKGSYRTLYSTPFEVYGVNNPKNMTNLELLVKN